MKILVCGGRNFNDRAALFRTLDHAQISHVIIGDAEGADALTRERARSRRVPLTIYFANWQCFGKAAGPLRNQEMLKSKPDRVIAFPGGKGTAHMVRIAQEAGFTVILAGEIVPT